MNEPLKLLLIGAKGRMGRAISSCAPNQNATLVGACDVGDDPQAYIENCDALIDFSFHETTQSIAELAVKHKKALVIGTTGHGAESKAAIVQTVLDKIPVVWAGNYSIGVNTLNYFDEKGGCPALPKV